MSAKALAAIEVKVYRTGGPQKPKKKRAFTFSFEEVARPPWMADIYLNSQIGTDFYQELFGCEALTDITLVTDTPQDPAAVAESLGINTNRKVKKITPEEAKKLRLLSANQKAVDRLNTVASILNDLQEGDDIEDRTAILVETSSGEQFKVPAQAIGGVPIEIATEQLADIYAFLKARGETDIRHFIENYTTRRFASMPEIFGYGWSGEALNDVDGPVKGAMGTFYLEALPPYDSHEMLEEIENARDGFHSLAYGDMKGLAYLDNRPLTNVRGKNKRKINPNVDTRIEKRTAILAYRNSLISLEGEQS